MTRMFGLKIKNGKTLSRKFEVLGPEFAGLFNLVKSVIDIVPEPVYNKDLFNSVIQKGAQ